MSDMTHSDAEEALVNGDAEDVEEALASELAEVCSVILRVLAPFPEARQAVAEALTGAPRTKEETQVAVTSLTRPS